MSLLANKEKMTLEQALKLKIISKITVVAYVLNCQKCGLRGDIRDPTKLPKACIHCKKDPYTGRKPKGRPKA